MLDLPLDLPPLGDAWTAGTAGEAGEAKKKKGQKLLLKAYTSLPPYTRKCLAGIFLWFFVFFLRKKNEKLSFFGGSLVVVGWFFVVFSLWEGRQKHITVSVHCSCLSLRGFALGWPPPASSLVASSFFVVGAFALSS